MTYFAVDRDVFDHPLFSKEPFSRRDAWVWLISEAKFKESDVFINGRIITLKRGQLSHSLRFISSKWGWDKGKTERFFRVLKTETMIETATETGQIIITICNYDIYQGQNKSTETATETATETRTRQERDSNETKKKKDKKERKEYIGEFLEFWDLYPRHEKKADAEKSFGRAIKEADHETIIAGVKRYAEANRGKDAKYIAHASTWLNGKRWTDESTPQPAEGELAWWK